MKTLCPSASRDETSNPLHVLVPGIKPIGAHSPRGTLTGPSLGHCRTRKWEIGHDDFVPAMSTMQRALSRRWTAKALSTAVVQKPLVPPDPMPCRPSTPFCRPRKVSPPVGAVLYCSRSQALMHCGISAGRRGTASQSHLDRRLKTEHAGVRAWKHQYQKHGDSMIKVRRPPAIPAYWRTVRS